MDALLMQYSLHVQKKIERRSTLDADIVQQLAVNEPQLAGQWHSRTSPICSHPPTMASLAQQVQRFYFNAGAADPAAVIPSFSIDASLW
jgi:hypothetical protein